MDEKEKLVQARDHINAARSILKTSAHPLAKVWLNKLDEVLEAVPKPQPRPADKPPQRAGGGQPRSQVRPTAAPRKKKRSATRTIIYFLFFVIILGGLLIAAVAYLDNENNKDTTPLPTQIEDTTSIPSGETDETPAPDNNGDSTETPPDGEAPPSE